jgi:signal transduction histidine kinase
VLEEAHAERSRLLDELRAASQAKDEFLAMLGHELRNPLSPIVTALQLMKMRGDLQSAKEQAIIQRQVDHLIRLVDDLLDVSRITRGKVELRTEAVEIAQVLAKSVEMASMLFEQRRHRLSIDVPPTGMLWRGDPTRLAQVVSNLLTNAARYTDPGGHVRLRAPPRRRRHHDLGGRQRQGPGARHAAPRVPTVLPGAPGHGPGRGRPRHRPGVGEEPGGAAWRQRGGQERGPRMR